MRHGEDRASLRDRRNSEMNRSKGRMVSRRWSSPEASRGNDPSSTEESSSPIDSTDYSPRLKNTSTPLRPRLSDLDEINRSRRGDGKIEGTEEKSSESFHGRKGRVVRDKYGDERRKDRRNRSKKRTRDRRSEYSDDEKQKDSYGSESSDEDYVESGEERSKRKKKQRSFREDNELPITEILRRSQENARTRYEQETPLPVLTTDKIYVQHRGGFSAVKLNQKRDPRGERKDERDGGNDFSDGQCSPPVRVAIMVQQVWKNTGLLCQGLLGGMALMHFIMLHVFFDTSTEFIVNYSTICEVYATVFSFLVAACIVSTFDKFDLARFDVEHLRELYLEYNRAVIAVPLYMIAFCLHQVCARTDARLNLIRYYSLNDSTMENATNVHSLADDLNSWQKISVSKDLLVVFAWLFVSLGTKDDSFLMYLRSMEKYANDVESSGQ